MCVKLCSSSCLSSWSLSQSQLLTEKSTSTPALHLHLASATHPNTSAFLLRFPCSAPYRSTGFSPTSVSFHLSVDSFKQMMLIPEIHLPMESVSSSRFSCRPFCLSQVSPLPPDSYLSYTQFSLNFCFLFNSLLFAIHSSQSMASITLCTRLQVHVPTFFSWVPAVLKAIYAVGYPCGSLLEMRVGLGRGNTDSVQCTAPHLTMSGKWGKQGRIITRIYRGRNWDSEKLRNVSVVTYPW